ncbi:MAG: BatA domain-containing protein, partial [Planctomycetaceae bacterium]|nr:BatA domain-containing protein [Planctomycetaceae bacterium]
MNGIKLLNPAALWFLFLLIPIFLMYFLKAQPRRMVVSTSIFWLEAVERNRVGNISLRRGRYYFLSFVLSLFFVLFLIAAAADPVYQADERQQKTVIVFDNSAIMNVKNNSGKTLFDDAREKLINLIDSTTSNQRIAIICTTDSEQFNNTEAAILTGFTENKKELKQKITSIRHTNIPSNLINSIDLATKFIELDDFLYNNSTNLSNTNANILRDSKILVFTANENLNLYEDKFNHNEKNVAYFSKPKIEFYLPDQPVQNSYNLNVAITRFQPRLFFDDLSRYELFVELCNFGDAVIETKLRIFVDERLFDVVSVLLNPRETRSYFINGEINQAGNISTKNFGDDIGLTIRGEVEIQDSFAADNIAYAILPPPMLQKILYYGEYNFFLVNALKSCMLSSRQPIRFERVTEIPEVVPTDSVLVINQNVPPILPTGNVMIFDPRNGCDLFGVGELLPSPSLVGVELRDSLLTKFLQF